MSEVMDTGCILRGETREYRRGWKPGTTWTYVPMPDYRRARGIFAQYAPKENPEVTLRRMRDDYP